MDCHWQPGVVWISIDCETNKCGETWVARGGGSKKESMGNPGTIPCQSRPLKGPAWHEEQRHRARHAASLRSLRRLLQSVQSRREPFAQCSWGMLQHPPLSRTHIFHGHVQTAVLMRKQQTDSAVCVVDIHEPTDMPQNLHESEFTDGTL